MTTEIEVEKTDEEKLQEFLGNETLVKKALVSLSRSFCTLDEILNGEAHEIKGFFYNDNNCQFCINCNEYFCGQSYEFRNGRNSVELCCRVCIDSESFDGRDVDNIYMTEETALNLGFRMCEESGRFESTDNLYYWECDDCFHCEPEPEPEPEPDMTDYLFSYKSCSRLYHASTNIGYLRCGFEIEKEDENVLTSINKHEFKKVTNALWCKESDGSLDDSSGYELVSPVFGLQDIPKIIAEIKSNPNLVDHINADYSSRCGGHIHISDARVDSSKQLLKNLESWIYLTYALFPKRATNSYCEKMSLGDLLQNKGGANGKYQAWRMTDYTVEIRIFNAVRDLRHLETRMYLVDAILSNQQIKPHDAISLVVDGNCPKFEKWVDMVYGDKKSEKFLDMVNRWKQILVDFNSKSEVK